MVKILSQILVFYVIFLVVFVIERIFLIAAFNEDFSFNFIFQTFAYGALHDTRAISIMFLPLILCGFLSYFVPFRTILSRIYIKISSFYIALVAFLCVIMAFVNYFWFLMYQNKIDIFIFGLKDDETSVLLKMIWNDYPILMILGIAILVAICCYFLNAKILKMQILRFRKKLNMPLFVCFNLAIILVYVISLRGSLTGKVAMNSNLYAFCHIRILNDIALNPMIALQWANKEYKNQFNLPQIDPKIAQNLENELFSIYDISRNGGGEVKS